MSGELRGAPGKRPRSRLWQCVLLGAVLLQGASLFYYVQYVSAHGYLPSPFLYDKSNTFMDLYNTLYWSGRDGRYTDWQSVYPPLNFIILDGFRLLFVPTWLQESDPFALRANAPGPAIVIAGLHLVAPFVVVATAAWRAFPPVERLGFAALAAFSAPLLFSLERGNLIILAMFLLPRALRANTPGSVFALAILINIKPYFALLLGGYLLAGNLRAFVQGVGLAGAIFVLSGLVIDPNFPQFLVNLFSFAGNDALFSGREVMGLPSSVSAFSYVLNLMVRASVAPGATTGWAGALPGVIELAKLCAVLALLVALLCARRRLTQAEMLAALLVVVVNLGIWVGGYSQMFYLAFIPALYGMRLRWVHLAIVIAVLCPLDLAVLWSDPIGSGHSYLSQSTVQISVETGGGAFVRPALNYLLMLTLSVEFVWRIARRAPPATHHLKRILA